MAGDSLALHLTYISHVARRLPHTNPTERSRRLFLFWLHYRYEVNYQRPDVPVSLKETKGQGPWQRIADVAGGVVSIES